MWPAIVCIVLIVGMTVCVCTKIIVDHIARTKAPLIKMLNTASDILELWRKEIAIKHESPQQYNPTDR